MPPACAKLDNSRYPECQVAAEAEARAAAAEEKLAEALARLGELEMELAAQESEGEWASARAEAANEETEALRRRMDRWQTSPLKQGSQGEVLRGDPEDTQALKEALVELAGKAEQAEARTVEVSALDPFMIRVLRL